MSPCPATYDSPPNYTTFSSPVLVVPFLNPSFMTHPPEEVQSLTGMISSSSTPYGSPAHEPTKGWLHRRTQLELGLLAALLAAVTAAIAVSVRFAVVERAGAVRGCIPPSCVHALGGGHVRSGGSIDSVTADRCKQELHAYADTNGGEYWKEVQLAADSAMDAFGFSNSATGGAASSAAPAAAAAILTKAADAASHTPAVSRSLLSSSRRVQQEQQQQQAQLPGSAGGPPTWMLGGPVAAAAASPQAPTPPTPSKDQVVVFDIDETVLSNMAQVLDPVTWPWEKWVAAAQAPPLQPVLTFYRALCSAGYTVAFVTGRREASRNATMANLAAAGYGQPCKQGPGPYYGTREGSGGSSGGDGDFASSVYGRDGSSNDGGCCYAALYLRQANDTRLASVYKPWARTQLLGAGGLKLLALVGDQFSDLNGEQSAPMAFKLPNPFYYIL